MMNKEKSGNPDSCVGKKDGIKEEIKDVHYRNY
jgi:hypothetical protein